MTEKTSQTNPNSPGGWGVQEVVNPDAYPNGELLAVEEQKRRDTAEWIDENNRSPIDNENPAQPAGFAVPMPDGQPIRESSQRTAGCNCKAGETCVCSGGECKCVGVAKEAAVNVTAKVFANKSAGRVEGAKVLLGTSQDNYQIGAVVAATEDKFWVAWRDGEDSIERKADYQLTIRDDEAG